MGMASIILYEHAFYYIYLLFYYIILYGNRNCIDEHFLVIESNLIFELTQHQKISGYMKCITFS
jgi:hypothetical protein